jgi:nitrate/nitrite transporter NarK
MSLGTLFFVGVGVTTLAMSALPPLAWGTLIMFCGMALLGMGNGSVFQLVPQRFPKEIGVITGIVGAARAPRLWSLTASIPASSLRRKTQVRLHPGDPV